MLHFGYRSSEPLIYDIYYMKYIYLSSCVLSMNHIQTAADQTFAQHLRSLRCT